MTRLKPSVRKEQILTAALFCAVDIGYTSFTRADVARRADVADALINRYYNTMPQLRRVVMRYAVQKELLSVIAQGLVIKDTQALKARKALRARALETML